MSLRKAHKGYEYQDVLTAYFILRELNNDNNCKFSIDKKWSAKDKFDDLTITSKNGIYKKQIKYSSSHSFLQNDLTHKSSYGLYVLDLYKSWESTRDSRELRLCLAWIISEKSEYLIPIENCSSFSDTLTRSYKLTTNGFKDLVQNEDYIEYNDSYVEDFCNKLIIELNFPKFSGNLSEPEQLEVIIINQLERLGIGEYPNEKMTVESVGNELIKLITNCRSNEIELTNDQILSKLKINTDYGAIEQIFPVDNNYNIYPSYTRILVDIVSKHNKIILNGEPGSGKSWLIQNLESTLKENGIQTIRHYCYTDLDDNLQKERITINKFFGNLISEILELFPELVSYKEHRYSSTLKELNLLLQKIPQKTLLVIDGLDHIQRIYEINSSILTRTEVDIISKIQRLSFSSNITLLIVTQPINELESLNDFHVEKIRPWDRIETNSLIKKYNLNNIFFEDGSSVIDFLVMKSEGNPLYLTYLVREISNLKHLNVKSLNSLPAYSNNLTLYYQYLLKQLETGNNIPYVFSGINFRITKNEVSEINPTILKKDIEFSFKKLSAVLRENTSQGGYSIYHESFRRFIFNKLKDEKESIELIVYKPIANWLKKKGLYKSKKSYIFLFEYLFYCNSINEILEYLSESFLIESLLYGHSWDSVINNYTYFLKAAITVNAYPQIVRLNEFSRILSSTYDEYERSFESYFNAVGYYFGFSQAVKNLVFEGKPTISPKQGIIACYNCNKNEISAPWNLYKDYFEAKETIEYEDFRLYVRYVLAQKDVRKIKKVFKQINNKKHRKLCKTFINEIENFYDKDFLNEIKNFNFAISYPEFKIDYDIDEIVEKILAFENVYENEFKTLELFFHHIDKLVINNNNLQLKNIIPKFKGYNWFYNWIIYFTKIKVLIHKKNYTYNDVKEAFNYLIINTDPFKGKPRTSDISNAYDLIYSSFNVGLALLDKEIEWEDIIKILIKVNETSVGFSGETWGPLSSDKLFRILDENVNEKNIRCIIKSLEKFYEKWKQYHLHYYITDYSFILSKLHSRNNNKEKALNYLRDGIQFILSYTFRKDTTIEELIDSIVPLSKFDGIIGKEYIRKIRDLVTSVDLHTEGKGTDHFLIEWFEKYYQVDSTESLLYLRDQLNSTPYYWKLERSLKLLLERLNGSINPIVELFLSQTFLIECSESFIENMLSLIDKVKDIDFNLADKNLHTVCDKIGLKSDIEYSENFYYLVNKKFKEFNLEKSYPKRIKPKQNIHFDIFREMDSKIRERKEFTDMSVNELTEYIDNNDLLKTEIISIAYFVECISSFDEDLKLLIKAIVKKKRWASEKINSDFDKYFHTNKDVYVYYWVCKYVFEFGSYYERFVNIDAFGEALKANKNLAIDFLKELLFEELLEVSYHRTIPANLINTFIRFNLNEDLIIEMWDNLFKAISFRLPVQEKYDWENSISNAENLTDEEILVCVLLTRFKANTKDRHYITISSIRYLLFNYPKMMIKPLRWFLQNKDSYSKITISLVIELIVEYKKIDFNFAKNFEIELLKIYPSKNFFIDYPIRLLLPELDNCPLFIQPEKIEIPVPSDLYDLFIGSNIRFEILDNVGKNIELHNIFAEYRTKNKVNWDDLSDLYFNRSAKLWVENIHPSEYYFSEIGERMNYDFCNSLYISEKNFYNNLKLQLDLLIAQYNSLKTRPDILKPFETPKGFKTHNDISVVNDNWVRIGHIEYQTYKKDRFDKNIEDFRVYSGVVFSNNIKDTIPFSRYRFNPRHLWGNENHPQTYDEYLCTFFLQMLDPFEQYRILWLNPLIIEKLGIKIGDINYGLNAYNSSNEICLKYNYWSTDYVGDLSLYNDITGEIPKLKGAELLLRKDYFDKVCTFFSEKPVCYSFSQ